MFESSDFYREIK